METTRLKQDIVAETVRSWIMQGKYGPGERLPTHSELAIQFNVNRCTVAAGLHQLTEENLLDCSPKRGSVVKGQTSLQTNAVPLVAPVKGEIYSTLIAKLKEHLLEQELYPVLMNEELINKSHEVSRFLHQMTKKSYPYGNLVLGDCFPYEEMNKPPLCFLTTVFLLRYHYYEEFPQAKYALIDYEAMGRMVVEYFAERNVKRILFPASPEIEYKGAWASLQVTLLNHIEKNAKAQGIGVDTSFFWRTHSGAPLDIVLPMAIQSSQDSFGIVSWSDSFFQMHVYPVLLQFSSDPVQEYAILGNFNTRHSADLCFDTFDHRVEEIAEIGVNMLTGKVSDRKILLPPRLIIRKKARNGKT